ncbi:MAG TPA: prolipoprotein diacylglyceryl transferase family protein, partial [Puia sp.]|nr:prolipoprotein diacylglyceryl transferase family protein [Puia sp.]
MFPNLGYLLRWLTGWNLSLPVPTFGFFMALSFWAAYAVFTLELRRRQCLTPATAAVPPDIRIGRLMDQLLLFCGLIGFAGALLLAKLEDSYNLWHHPGQWLLRYHGLTYLGGLIFGAITYLVMLKRRGIPLATAADIGSPGMMLAYAIGRIGCHLAGDGDWGILSTSPKPAWL